VHVLPALVPGLGRRTPEGDARNQRERLGSRVAGELGSRQRAIPPAARA
jgi:hypothetical protein